MDKIALRGGTPPIFFENAEKNIGGVPPPLKKTNINRRKNSGRPTKPIHSLLETVRLISRASRGSGNVLSISCRKQAHPIAQNWTSCDLDREKQKKLNLGRET